MGESGQEQCVISGIPHSAQNKVPGGYLDSQRVLKAATCSGMSRLSEGRFAPQQPSVAQPARGFGAQSPVTSPENGSD